MCRLAVAAEATVRDTMAFASRKEEYKLCASRKKECKLSASPQLPGGKAVP